MPGEISYVSNNGNHFGDADNNGSREEPGANGDVVDTHLADDAQWKKIQQNTFTRWCNEHLKKVDQKIGNLETDLSDGLLLIQLAQVLSHKRLPKWNKKPNFRSQKLENVSVALKFLQEVEGIRIVNIDSSDIVDQRLKLILGLIWMLILHYSISIPIWDEEDGGNRKNNGGAKQEDTPKRRLLHWIQSKIPDCRVGNFTSDWNDGRNLGALVEAIHPGLNPEWRQWDPNDALSNATKAMDKAEDSLGVAKLMHPEEMVNPRVDELSVMTYLSQYPNARYQPPRPKTPPPPSPEAQATGPGLRTNGNHVNQPTHFTVEPSNNTPAELSVNIRDGAGRVVPADIRFNSDINQFQISYVPLNVGPHKVVVEYGDAEVSGSPFRVDVSPEPVDPSRVRVSGPGIAPDGNIAQSPTSINIDVTDAGPGSPSVIVRDPSGNESSVPVKLSQDSPTSWRAFYTPPKEGVHSLMIQYAGRPVPGSPYRVNIAPAVTPGKIRVWGRGIEENGPRDGDNLNFTVDTNGAGKGRVTAKVWGPNGEVVSVRDQGQSGIGEHSFAYNPLGVGLHKVEIYFADEHIPRSPFPVMVREASSSSIRAYGPGLEGGMTNLPAHFSVETNGQVGALGFQIQGPSEAKISCTDNKDGSAEISYLPTAPGRYSVHVLCNDENIPNSPFIVHIKEFNDSNKPSYVRCYGPGLSHRGVLRGQQTEFTVETANAGPGPLTVWALDNDYSRVHIDVSKVSENRYNCRYTPTAANKHRVIVAYGEVAAAGCPYRVIVEEPVDPSRVSVYGPGLGVGPDGVYSKRPTHVIVDCKHAGPGEVDVTLAEEGGGPKVDIDILDNHDGTFTINYTAPRPGNYQLQVIFAGTEIPGSPIRINVQPHLDVSGVRVEGLNNRIFLESSAEFTIDAKSVNPAAGGGEDVVVVNIRSPSDSLVECHLVDNHDGIYTAQFTPFEEGAYHIEVLYDSISIPESPLTVYAVRGHDAGRCYAYGPGLTSGLVNIPCTFTVQTKGAGQGGLGISVEGPEEARMECTDNRDGTVNVEYIPVAPGDYAIAIKFADTPIPGSPFHAYVDYPVDASLVKAWGPGLEQENIRAGGVPLKFHINASESGYAPLQVEVKPAGRASTARPAEVVEKGGGLYDVTWWAPPEGATTTLNVKYGGNHIPNSPYQFRSLPEFEPNKVEVAGDALRGQIPASLPCKLIIDTRRAGSAKLEAQILGPENEDVPLKLAEMDGENNVGRYELIFTPEDAGAYGLRLTFGGRETSRQPHRLTAYATGSPEKCFVMDGIRDSVVVNEEYFVTINSGQGGNAALSAKLFAPNGKRIPTEVQDNKDGTHTVYYRATEIGRYRMRLQWGGHVIPKGEWNLTAASKEDLIQIDNSRLLGSRKPGELHPLEFWNVPLPEGAKSDQLKGIVIMPSKRSDVPQIKENADGTVTIKYQPREIGLHELNVTHNGNHVQGSPFQFNVDEISSGGNVTAYGPGLSYGAAGEPAAFTVCAKEAGAGGLSVSVEGPAKADIKCHDNKDGTCGVTWIPPGPGEYKVHVKFADKEIKGSPFTARIAGEGRKRAQLSVGSTSEVSLKISEADIKGLSASIKSPSGIEEPCFIRKLEEGHLGISFTPREVGEHLVSVKKRGTLIPKAPFRIHVGEREVGDAGKVKVSGTGLLTGRTQEVNQFTVDTRNAGFGGLSVSLEGPSKSEIQCKDNKDGTCQIHYRPTEPGMYVLGIKFADHHVQGSPFTVTCSGQGLGTITERISSKRDQASACAPGKECEVFIRLPGASSLDLVARMMDEEGNTEDVTIMETSDSEFVVRFTPRKAGQHAISVLHKGQHVSGSPFQFTVGEFGEGGSHKVRAGGNGLFRGEVQLPNSFNIYTREAGPGDLKISIEGPSKAKIDFKDHKDGNCYVLYNVTKAGDYAVSIKFDDKHIPDSPFKVYITPSTGEARKLSLASFPDRGLQLNKPLTFTIMMNGAKGSLGAKVVSPSGNQDDCFITPIDENDTYAVRFIPKETGVHYIHILLDGTHMVDSPFRLRVGGRDEADPTALTASGTGLTSGETGHKCEFIVNTCNAGAGLLECMVEGPSKVTLDVYEVDVGYKVRYTPMAPGEYFLTIKYNGVHIPGSPFKAKMQGKSLGGSGYNEPSYVKVDTVSKSGKGGIVEDAPAFKGDASKVDCKGMGLKKAYVGRLNHFNVDCSQAGQDLLWVSVVTPKGPSEEVYVKHQGRGLYIVNYQIKEKGRCYVFVKYGNNHVPGSPFPLTV